MTETWREPINRDRVDQTSKSVVSAASPDGPHVKDVPSDRYRFAAYVLRSDVRIGNVRQSKMSACYCQRGSRKQKNS